MAYPTASLLAALVGPIAPLGSEGLPSGIDKQPVSGRILVTSLGLAGDAHADLRHHGGVEKAVHHYPQEHYAAWRGELPERAGLFVVGGFGENLSTLGLSEETVCVGDIFRVGGVLLQVSQGRTPCRKLDLRFGVADMVARVRDRGRTGWYYRVLETGELAAGDVLTLRERPCPEWSIARVQRVLSGEALDMRGLAILAGLQQLAPGWRDKAAMRLVANKD